jgi:multidrug efflux pump subunit AcrA (membrane-fusion protein)
MTKSSILFKRSILIGLLVLASSFALFKLLSSLAKKSPIISSFKMVNVITKSVDNQDFPLQISLSGKLVSRNRIDLYSEVNGVLLSKNFREGNTYSNGQIVARMDDRELTATIKSQKSSLLNSISQILPDVSLDFSDELESWKKFHESIRFDRVLPAIPETSDEQLKLFISSRNIYSNYFNVKSLEERLGKYTIRAPFGGVLSVANISTGALVRPGQKMGTYIEPGMYELEASASIDDLRYIKVGDRVELNSNEVSGAWQGSILRINRSMDPTTQMVKVYIGVNEKSLREGQYLVANIQGTTLESVCEISRQFMLEGDRMYFVESDSVLTIKNVNVAYRGVENVYIKDLSAGWQYLNQVVSNGYEGMIVKIIGNKENLVN